MSRGMAWPAVGVVGGGHGRQEHAARPMLVWAAGARRSDIEEAARPLD